LSQGAFMDHRKNMITLNTDGNDFPSEFAFIKNLIDVNGFNEGGGNVYGLHIFMEAEFGPLWRLVAFHLIDQSSSDPDERMKLLKALEVNCYRDCDGGFDLDDVLPPEKEKLELNKFQKMIKEFRHYLNADRIVLADMCAVKGLAMPNLPIEMIIELLFFFVRYDDGYKKISKLSDKILPKLNKQERSEVIGLLLKLIDIGYMEKLDLSIETTAYIVKDKGST
jgi:hypothetical protein